MKILLAHGDLSARGGAEAYAEAMLTRLHALGHRVDILDIDGLRAALPKAGIDSGLKLGPDPRPAPQLLRLGRLPGLRRLHLVKYALVCRVLPPLAHGYDRVVLSYGEGPVLPCPTLTLRHAPALFSTAPRYLNALGARGPVTRRLRAVYTRLCRGLAGIPRDPPATSRLLANSRWTAAMIPPEAGRAEVLYPQVRPLPAPVLPASALPAPVLRTSAPRDRFRIVTLGRIVPNKRLEKAVQLTARLRAEGLPAQLDIIGRADTPYARRLIRRLRGHPHLRLYPDATPVQLTRLLANARIGLHCYRQEHFGIAIAEMILAGLLPVIHDGGGAVELVEDPTLRYRTQDEAVAVLKRLMQLPKQEVAAISTRLQQGQALRAALDFPARCDAVLARHLSAA